MVRECPGFTEPHADETASLNSVSKLMLRRERFNLPDRIKTDGPLRLE